MSENKCLEYLGYITLGKKHCVSRTFWADTLRYREFAGVLLHYLDLRSVPLNHVLTWTGVLVSFFFQEITYGFSLIFLPDPFSNNTGKLHINWRDLVCLKATHIFPVEPMSYLHLFDMNELESSTYGGIKALVVLSN